MRLTLVLVAGHVQIGLCALNGGQVRCAMTIPAGGQVSINPTLRAGATDSGADARWQVGPGISACGRPGVLKAGFEMQGRQNVAQNLRSPGGPFSFTASSNLCVEVFVSRCSYRTRHSISR